MTVLLVDDQINILSGLISALNWDALGITEIRTATNARKAKDILEAEHVDILLCDIEMPGENGLSLLRWARNRGMDFVCVFLTSHADFMYAKEAIQLNCFDYVLQPARIDEIQAVISKAIDRVRENSKREELQHYGYYVKSTTAISFENLFSDWSAGLPLSVSKLQAAFRQFHFDMDANSDCFLIWCHLLRWHAEPWSTHEWTFSLNNILTEVYEASACKSISYSVNHSTIGWFFLVPGNVSSKSDEIFAPLERAYLTVSQYYPCDFAFYATPVVPLEQVGAQLENLTNVKRDNVLQRKGVFRLDDAAHPPQIPIGADNMQIHRWGDLLMEGQGQTLKEEIFKYFDSLSNGEKLNYQFLHNFWLQFQQVVLNTIWHKEMDGKQLVPILNQGERAQSVQEVREAVAAITEQFQSPAKTLRDEKELVQKVEIYVEGHLDQPLSVNDVADALFVSANYLSYLFKSKRNLSLKQYITNRKMESAQLLLRTTSLPIGTVASKMGYDNFSHFSQVYRKTMGVSPTDERK